LDPSSLPDFIYQASPGVIAEAQRPDGYYPVSEEEDVLTKMDGGRKSRVRVSKKVVLAAFDILFLVAHVPNYAHPIHRTKKKPAAMPSNSILTCSCNPSLACEDIRTPGNLSLFARGNTFARSRTVRNG
jgi:hypothetical protein